MSKGVVPFHAWIISPEKLQLLLPAAWAELQHTLSRYEVTLDELARAIEQEEQIGKSADASQDIQEALHELYEQFITATTVGESFLDLELIHYDPETGDSYDQLEPGANWLVGGVREFSPAGRKFQNDVEWKGWITYC